MTEAPYRLARDIHPLFAARIREWLKTLRKKNVGLGTRSERMRSRTEMASPCRNGSTPLAFSASTMACGCGSGATDPLSPSA